MDSIWKERRERETMANVQNSFFIVCFFVWFMKQQNMWQAVCSTAVRLYTHIFLYVGRQVWLLID